MKTFHCSRAVHIFLVVCVLTLTLIAMMSTSKDKGLRTSHQAYERLVYVSSANSEWYRRMKSDFSNTILDPRCRPDHELRLYHEDEMPSLPDVTTINLFEVVPWLKQELVDRDSGLNKYYKLSQYFDPTTDPMEKGKVGSLKVSHLLLMKVTAIQHAIRSSPEGTVIFWVDTDVSFRAPLPAGIIQWLGERDVTYIPFQLKLGKLLPDESYLASNKFEPTNERDLRKYLQFEYWVLETGLFAFSVNARTKAYIDAVVALYRGGMYNLALQCLNGDSKCKLPRYRLNLFLNDIFAFNLPLQSDIHGDEFFHVGLKHGWFAMHGLSWEGKKWGYDNPHYLQHLVSMKRSDSLVTNFYIGEYVFHHFGTHKKGGLSAQLHNAEEPSRKRDSWRLVTDDIIDYNISLELYLEECVLSKPEKFDTNCKNIVKRAQFFDPYRLDDRMIST